MFETDPSPDLHLLIVPVRPVLVTLPLPSLLEVSQHHDHGYFLLYDHLPEVLKGDRLWSDGGDEFLLDVCKSDQGGIQVGNRRISFEKFKINRCF